MQTSSSFAKECMLKIKVYVLWTLNRSANAESIAELAMFTVPSKTEAKC